MAIVDYPGAVQMLITSPDWVFTDALQSVPNSDISIVIHKTACGGACTAISVADYFGGDTASHKSSHFIVGRDGIVVQVVLLKDGAGANCCLEPGHDTYWDPLMRKYGNLNRCTISIEMIDETSDNTQTMPEVQIVAAINLCKWLAHRYNLPYTHFKGHNSIDPISRQRDPGPTWPWSRLQQALSPIPTPDTNSSVLLNFPMVKQTTTTTGDGQPSENANYDCVAASICASVRWHLNQPENAIFNPDHFKDVAAGQGYVGGTAARQYVSFCASLGVRLRAIQGTPAALIGSARQQLRAQHPVLFTEPSPYASGWWHVCVFYKDDGTRLTALDPWLGAPVTKTYAQWQALLQENQIWITERMTTYMEQQFDSVWLAGAGTHADGTRWKAWKSGIYTVVKAAFLGRALSAVSPVSDEIKAVDWSGNAGVWQNLSSGDYVFYRDGHGTIYNNRNERIWG